jgi:hypothetical protein
VKKLKAARDRKRIGPDGKRVKVEGRKSYAETKPEMVALARRLHRYPAHGRRRSLRDVAAELARQGYTGPTGAPYAAAAIKSMVEA